MPTKSANQIPQIVKKALDAQKERERSIEAYPELVVETIIFHRLHFGMTPTNALKSFHLLLKEFVDWNEIRVSTIQEIRDQLKSGLNSLDTAVFIKDFLELVHRVRQCVDLEFLSELNLTEVRRFLKQVRGIDHSTIDLVLYKYKEHPVFPLSAMMESIVQHAGLVKAEDTRDRKAKTIHELVDNSTVLPFHHFLIDLEREISASLGDDMPTSDQISAMLKANKAALRSACSGFVKKGKGSSDAKAKTTTKKAKTRN